MNKILIVEDDPKIAMSLVIRLKASGYIPSVAPDALAGASLARAFKPDLILLDISMPGGNGFQLAETLHRIPDTNGTPIIFMTASKNPELLQKVMTLGAIGLFEKPFEMDKLLSCIDSKFNRMADVSNAQQRSTAPMPRH
jgi:DNA-binding response OmpR family regulator